MPNRFSFIRVLVATVFALAPAAASAAPITFDFTVTVTQVKGLGPTFFPTLDVGDTFSGKFTFDDGATDLSPSPLVGSYEGLGTTLNIDGKQLAWSKVGIGVSNFPTADTYAFGDEGTATLPSGFPSASFDVTLLGPSTIFANTALPLTPPALALFRTNSFTLSLGTSGVAVNGRLTSLAVATPPTPVPEPASLLLVGSGLSGVAWARRRRHGRAAETQSPQR